ncbi:IS3 family transposase [Treponema sp.]
MKLLFDDWVHWYNNIRFHSANGNKSPVAYRKEFNKKPLKKIA